MNDVTSDAELVDPDLAGRRGLRVAVIGAGVSGLVAAYMLAEDHEVTVFEARERVGVDQFERRARCVLDTRPRGEERTGVAAADSLLDAFLEVLEVVNDATA